MTLGETIDDETVEETLKSVSALRHVRSVGCSRREAIILVATRTLNTRALSSSSLSAGSLNISRLGAALMRGVGRSRRILFSGRLTISRLDAA